MFDFTLKLFDAHFPSTKSTAHSLVLSGCKTIINASQNVYSELDELNFSDINRNDFRHGYMEIELYFENTFDNPYFRFNAKCFSIRTDSGVTIKCNGYVGNQYYTKVSKEGKLVIGIRYYFCNETEIQFIKECSTFLLEGFLSFRKNTNVYGVMCELSKANDIWYVVNSNTYKPHGRCNIANLVH